MRFDCKQCLVKSQFPNFFFFFGGGGEGGRNLFLMNSLSGFNTCSMSDVAVCCHNRLFICQASDNNNNNDNDNDNDIDNDNDYCYRWASRFPAGFPA